MFSSFHCPASHLLTTGYSFQSLLLKYCTYIFWPLVNISFHSLPYCTSSEQWFIFTSIHYPSLHLLTSGYISFHSLSYFTSSDQRFHISFHSLPYFTFYDQMFYTIFPSIHCPTLHLLTSGFIQYFLPFTALLYIFWPVVLYNISFHSLPFFTSSDKWFYTIFPSFFCPTLHFLTRSFIFFSMNCPNPHILTSDFFIYLHSLIYSTPYVLTSGFIFSYIHCPTLHLLASAIRLVGV